MLSRALLLLLLACPPSSCSLNLQVRPPVVVVVVARVWFAALHSSFTSLPRPPPQTILSHRFITDNPSKAVTSIWWSLCIISLNLSRFLFGLAGALLRQSSHTGYHTSRRHGGNANALSLSLSLLLYHGQGCGEEACRTPLLSIFVLPQRRKGPSPLLPPLFSFIFFILVV